MPVRLRTKYQVNGLWSLLKNTCTTVRNFDKIKDKTSFDLAIAALAVDGEVILQQNRLLFIAS